MASPSSSSSRHLIHQIWRRSRIPLKRLTQGSTLSIKSSLSHPANVLIQPGWREDGMLELEHRSRSLRGDSGSNSNDGSPFVEMTVRHEDQKKTSMGRLEPHVSLHLSPFSSHGEDGARSDEKPSAIERIILDGNDEEEAPCAVSEPTTDPAGEDGGGGAAETETFLTVKAPEKLNLICDLGGGDAVRGGVSGGGGNITVDGKIEGDVSLKTRGGDISATKLRGHEIDLETTSGGGGGKASGTIYARDLLEAEKLTISASGGGGRVRAKQILGRRIEISVNSSAGRDEEEGSDPSSQPSPPSTVQEKDEDDEGSLVDVGALFVSGNAGATVDIDGEGAPLRRRAVRIKSHHGPMEVLVDGCSKPAEASPITGTIYPLVELGGVNGNCEVSVKNTTSVDEGDDGWTSCHVHFDSLSPNTVSLITVDRGDTTLTLDRKVESDVRMLSSSSDECLTETAALLAEEEDADMILSVVKNLPKGPHVSSSGGGGRISIDTSSFTSRLSHAPAAGTDEEVEYVDGWVENKSEEPDSRFEQRFGRSDTGLGKIRLDSAAAQALKGFAKDGGSEGRGDDQEEKEPVADDAADPRPLVAVASTGRISLETVSWIGAIARRYGLDEEETRRKGGGRTASRKGRPIVPQEQ